MDTDTNSPLNSFTKPLLQVKANSPLAVTVAELAGMLHVSKRHIERQEAAGKIGPKPVRFGKSKRYVMDGPNGIRAWLAAGAPDRREWEARQRMQGGAT